MKKVFIYPTFDARRDKSGNQYILRFREAFENAEGIKVLNRFQRSETLGLLLNADADVFILHWVDLIPSKPLGTLQTLFFKCGVLLAKRCGRKIVWVLHNKTAHDKSRGKAEALMDWMSERADAVIVHSGDGVDFFHKRFPASRAACSFIPHPVYSEEMYANGGTPEYDYVVWGSITPRKNVLEFVRFAAADPSMKDKRILICGRCASEELDADIRQSLRPGIDYENRFFSDEELHERIGTGAVILFTYSEKSLLSSGALIYSLNFGKPVIGPDSGAFLDLPGVVACFNDFSQIASLSQSGGYDPTKAREYISENTWARFPAKFIAATD